ncbi:unnamed protein product [Arctogadus glacialis]
MDGDLLTSESSSYLVEDFLGEGSFGKVARCVSTATNEKVAVKIIKNHPELLATARQEIVMLRFLRVVDPDTCGIVRWMGFFKHGPHVCLVFELLKQSLMDFAMQTADRTLPLRQIKHILEQYKPDQRESLSTGSYCMTSQYSDEHRSKLHPMHRALTPQRQDKSGSRRKQSGNPAEDNRHTAHVYPYYRAGVEGESNPGLNPRVGAGVVEHIKQCRVDPVGPEFPLVPAPWQQLD